MLKSLKIEKFTVFPKADFSFGKNLNVLVGANGTGKSHILKLAYSGIAASVADKKTISTDKPTKIFLATALANKLVGVFKPDSLGRLVSRRQGREKCNLQYKFSPPDFNLSFSFNTSSKKEVIVEKCPAKWMEKSPAFLPTRELLSISPGFVSLYETSHIPFEETWNDTCLLLNAPLAKGPREEIIRKLIEPIEEAMGGNVTAEEGRFYLNLKSGKMEMHLVAEGLRKLATLARLIATGTLADKGYLFWDEPEANLNAKIIKSIAKTILQLAKGGIQVFIATHSLFLLRELHILQKGDDFKYLDTRYFGIHTQADGMAEEVLQGNTMDAVGDIAVLDEELGQSERYMDIEMGLASSKEKSSE